MADESAFSKVRAFRLTGVSGSYVAKACRVALAPLAAVLREDDEAVGLETDHREAICADYARLIAAWRKRVNLLASHHATMFQEPADYVAACNCAPIGANVQHKSLKHCRRRIICPWCWCKQHVRETFYRFCRVLYKSLTDDTPYPYSLVRLQTDRFYPVGPHGWTAADILQGFVKKDKGTIYRQAMPQALGASVLCSLEPPQLRKPNPCWRLRHRVLAVVRADDVTDYDRNPRLPDDFVARGAFARRDFKHVACPRQLDLAIAVGNYARYPELLMTGGLERTVQILQAYSTPTARNDAGRLIKSSDNVCLSAVYGVLRSKFLLPAEDHDQIPIISMETSPDERSTLGASG